MDSYKVKDFCIVDFYLSVRNKALKNHSLKIKNGKVVAIDPLSGHSDGFIPIEEYEKEDDGIPILFEHFIPINEDDSTDIYIE